jgi:hypothetical protein
MRFFIAMMMVFAATPTFAQSYGNAGIHSGAYGNAGSYRGAYGNAGDHVGAYGNYRGGYGATYPNSSAPPFNYAAQQQQQYAEQQMYAQQQYAAEQQYLQQQYAARQQYAQQAYGNAGGYRYSPYQAENGDYRNYDNDYDGRREPTHVRGHYHSRNGYTRGHHRALPYR